MSEEYRGEGLGFYYIRLQARREQERRQRQEHGSIDSSTQVNTLETRNTSDQEAQTDGAGTSSTPPGATGAVSPFDAQREQGVLAANKDDDQSGSDFESGTRI